MAARSQARWGSLVIAAVAGTCVALAGCSSSTTSTGANTPSTSLPSGAVTVPPAPSGNGVTGLPKLTGNFCTDLKDIGTNFQLPASAQSSVKAARKQGVQYLSKLNAYFTGLEKEAPPQVASDLRTIAADLQSTASSISTKSLNSLPKIEQRLQSLTTNGATGTAFRNLIGYLVVKCR